MHKYRHWLFLCIEQRQVPGSASLIGCKTYVQRAPLYSGITFGPNVGQIDTKWEKSGTFMTCYQIILADPNVIESDL